MKSISGRSPSPQPLTAAWSGAGGGVRCRNTILLPASRWYLTLPARVPAEPPGEKTWASRIRSARRALPAPPTKPTATTPSREAGDGAGPAEEGVGEAGGGVRESTRTGAEWVAGAGGGGGSIAGGEVRAEEVALVWSLVAEGGFVWG